MFTSIFILLLPFLAIAFLPMIVKSFFSSAELDEMGVCLKNSEMMSDGAFQESDPIAPKMTVTCANA